MVGARRAQATSHLSGYLAGNAGRNLVSGRGRFNAFLRHVTTRYTAPALFILAILPLPVFDVAGILAGALRMSVVKFLAVVIAGKIIKHVPAAPYVFLPPSASAAP